MLTIHTRRFSPLVLVAALTSPATAIPLDYAVDAQASNSSVVMGTVLSADSSLDVTDGIINGDAGQLPLNSTVVNGINTEPSSSSYAIADVGLPDDFASGANGITFQDLVIDYASLPGPINTFTFSTSLAGLGLAPGGPLGLPFGVVESPLLLFFASVQTASLNIAIDAPFSSALTANPLVPGEYLWAGTANATISGAFTVSGIPGVDPLDPVPFSQQVNGLPLAGTFGGDAFGNEIVVGYDADALDDFLENQDLSTDPVAHSVDVPVADLLDQLVDGGLITALQLQGLLLLLPSTIAVDISLQQLLSFDANTGIHYTNSTPVPEPGTALLVGVGTALLAGARRMR